MRVIQAPEPGEYPAYSEVYLSLVPRDGEILKHLRDNFQAVKNLLEGLSEEQLLFRYGPGKWSVKEVILHIIDDERIFAYRALRFARNDSTGLPGFEQDDYVVPSRADERSLASLLDEYETVRNATISLFAYLPEESFMRSGTLADGSNRRTVRAMVYHIAGHELHHLNIIREKYL